MPRRSNVVGRVHTLSFESVSECLAYAWEGTPRAAGSSSAAWLKEARHSWAGLPAGANPKTFFADGWDEGAERIAREIARVEAPTTVSVRRKPRWADAGDELSRDRLYAGQMDTMWRATTRVASNRPTVIRIGIDSIASAFVPAETMFWRGAAAAALTDLLCAAGHTVEVVSAFRGYCEVGQEMLVSTTVVKAASDTLNMSTLAATAACPAFFRLVGHATQNMACRVTHTGTQGMSVNTLQPEDVPSVAGERVLIAPQSIANAAQASAWVAESVASIEGGAA